MATKAETIADIVEARIDDNMLVASVAVDGQSARYMPWAEQKAAYLFFKRRAAREQGRRPLVASINLSSAWG